MFKGFKDFITRGNVIDLAVAVVIGTAFAAVVNTVVSKIITPVLNAMGGGNASKGLGFEILAGNPSTYVDLSAIINALIVFLLTALVVYFIFVLPMNKYKEARGLVAEDPVDESLVTLKEIRDLLAQRKLDGTL